MPEYLRSFTDAHARTPRQDEQAHILQEQVRQEQAALACASEAELEWVFCDTCPLLTAIYSDCVFGDASLYPDARKLHERYALTLLLEPTIAWVADGLQRDGVEARQRVHDCIVRELASGNWPYAPWQSRSR